jgi:hypothetical protein
MGGGIQTFRMASTQHGLRNRAAYRPRLDHGQFTLCAFCVLNPGDGRIYSEASLLNPGYLNRLRFTKRYHYFVTDYSFLDRSDGLPGDKLVSH